MKIFYIAAFVTPVLFLMSWRVLLLNKFRRSGKILCGCIALLTIIMTITSFDLYSDLQMFPNREGDFTGLILICIIFVNFVLNIGYFLGLVFFVRTSKDTQKSLEKLL